jgi:glycosyltransferase involved in cell wall biosynthesis
LQGRGGMSATAFPRRLLMVVNDASFLRSHRWPLALAAREAGWLVEVASAPGESLEWIRSQGLPVHEIPFNRKGVNPIVEARSVLSLWRLYASVRPAVIHHITIKPILYGSLAARWLRLPAVINAVTGLGYVFSRQGMAARLAQAVLRRAYRYALGYQRATAIFQNPDDVKEIWGLAGHPRAEIIPGAGVDSTEYPLQEELPGTPIILLASRMLWSKGVGDFVEAAKLCRADGLACRFVLVGDSDPGNPDAIPFAVLQRWNAEGIVEWWGRRHDMPNVFRCSHVVVLPTIYREGVPKVLIEAASTGRPLIATDMPGCREIVMNGANGYLVKPNNPLGLYECIGALVKDKSLRQSMGIRGHQYVIDRFSVSEVLSRTLSIYNKSDN